MKDRIKKCFIRTKHNHAIIICNVLLMILLGLEITTGYKAFATGKIYSEGVLFFTILLGYSSIIIHNDIQHKPQNTLILLVVITIILNSFSTYIFYLPSWTIILVNLLIGSFSLFHNTKLRVSLLIITFLINIVLCSIMYPFVDIEMYHSILNQSEQASLSLNNDVVNIKGIETIMPLQKLFIQSERVISYKPIEELLNLDTIMFSYCDLSKLKEVKPMLNVTSLIISNTKGHQFSLETVFPSLKYLLIKDLDSNNLVYLDGLIYLETLELSSSEIDNLSGIQNLTHLTTLKLDHVTVNDLSILEDLEHLHTIILSNCDYNQHELDQIIKETSIIVEIN